MNSKLIHSIEFNWTGIASGRSPTCWVTLWAPESFTTWAGTSWSRYHTRTRCRGSRCSMKWTLRRIWRKENRPTACRRRRTPLPMLLQPPSKSSGSRRPCESRPRLWSKQFNKRQQHQHHQPNQRYLTHLRMRWIENFIFFFLIFLSFGPPPHPSLSALSTIELETFPFIWFLTERERERERERSNAAFFKKIPFSCNKSTNCRLLLFFSVFEFVASQFLISTWCSWNLLDHRPPRKTDMKLHTYTHLHTYTLTHWLDSTRWMSPTLGWI